MQLFTLGLTQLNPDGTPVLDQNNNPVPTYDQAVVTNMAKVLTGWTYPTAPGATAKTNNPAYYFGQMFAVEAEHDTTAKDDFQQHHHPRRADRGAGSGRGARRADGAADHGAVHQPATDPAPGDQQSKPGLHPARLAGFRERRQRRDGNLKAVITAILTDPEARAGDDPNAAVNPNFGHLREPILFMPNLLRGLNATAHRDQQHLRRRLANMGENLFNAAQRVQLFLAADTGTADGLLGPEFQIYSTQTAADPGRTSSTSILYGTLDSEHQRSIWRRSSVRRATPTDLLELHQLRISCTAPCRRR